MSEECVLPAKMLSEIVAYLLVAAGASERNAAEVGENLVEAELLGRVSHGARLVATYVERLKIGEVSGSARPELAGEQGGLTRISGNRAFGQIVGEFAAETGILRAREHGVALVAVDNSGHLGRNGRWPELAARAGVASVHFGHSFGRSDSVVPFGGTEPRLRSSPVAFGAPFADGDVVLDFSVAEMSANAVKHTAERGEKLPSRAVVGRDGSPSDDPSVFTAGLGGLLPFGGHKGYGIAIFAEIFAGILASGGAGEHRTNALLSLYIDVRQLRNWEDYQAELAGLLAHVRSAPAAAGSSGVFIPGERSREARARRLEQGIALTATLRASLNEASRNAGVQDRAASRWPAVFRQPARA